MIETTIIRDATAEAAVHELDKFLQPPIRDLSLADQYLFQRFGQGPITKLPFYCIHHAFEQQAKMHPRAIAAYHQGATITYAELNRNAQFLAKQLIDEGVQKGDNVGLFVQRSIPMLIGILGILKAGAVYVPQHIGVTPEEQLSYVIDAASIQHVLTIKAFKHLVPVVTTVTTLVIDEFTETIPVDAIAPTLPTIPITAQDGCYIIFTSGTTGMPNGVVVSHGNLCNVVLTEPGNLGIRPGLKVGQILSISFDMSVWEIFGALANGASLVIRGKDIQETVSEVDIVISTPTILSTLDTNACKNVKVVAVAGEPCPRILAEKWAEFSAFYNSCGPTETTIVNTAQRFFPTDQVVSIGTPMPNNTVYILDENRQPCKIGEVGEMWAGGYCVSKGYINNATLTEERYADDPFLGAGFRMFRTRDLARWTPNGGLEHFGRTDDQVKILGFRVELDAISSIAEQMPQTKRAVTLKVDHKTLALFISPATATTTIDIEAIKKRIEETLPYYYVPKIVIPIAALPMTRRGKIDKRKLKEVIAQIPPEPQETIPEKPPEKTVVATKMTKHQETPPPDLDTVVLPTQKRPLASMWKGEKLMHYYRLFALLVLTNMGILIYGSTTADWWTVTNVPIALLAKIALINFSIGILIRQQYVINMLFGIATSIPVDWPLWMRRRAGKIYHFGGIHIGGTVSGTFWYVLFTASIYYLYFVNNTSNVQIDTPLVWSTSMISALCIGMIIMALPSIRAKYHNQFEQTHRFGGWLSLGLLWWQLIHLQQLHTPTQPLIHSTNFWLLSLITLSILLPWLRLKKVKVDITKPSNHAILARFNYGVTPFAGSSTAISRSPLLEWHSFANVPEPGRDGFRLTISRAGDWTGKLIDDMPSHVWVKGISTAGVGNIDQLFKKVIWVATGSGIGPCLPHLLAQEVPSKLVWATRNPRKTFGDALVDEIMEVQPEALIWDTDAYGKPDMVKLAYKAYMDFGAEAIICISNKKLTWKVVYGMESRGIPAYGAIWDS